MPLEIFQMTALQIIPLVSSVLCSASVRSVKQVTAIAAILVFAVHQTQDAAAMVTVSAAEKCVVHSAENVLRDGNVV
ncbi:MAG: hypothetical protein M1834_006921 [Cirrosporium novae-zelandiae]|nr:MAG: hypothetical protein M1834_006921 [Cirrosporium novae-zelandiae]